MISSKRKGLVALSLERSKAAPLEIWLDMGDIGKVPWLPNLLVPYFQNIEILQVTSSSSIELVRTLPNSPQLTPNLRSLSFTRRGYNWDRPIDSFGPLSTLSPTLMFYLVRRPSLPVIPPSQDSHELVLYDKRFDPHPDVLLDFLEENRSLEIVELGISPTREFAASNRGQEPTSTPIDTLPRPDERPVPGLQYTAPERCTSENHHL